MTKVYLVTAGSYSDYRVLGVFSTRELAQRAHDHFNVSNVKLWPIWEVEVNELASLVDHGLWEHKVVMKAGGRTAPGALGVHRIEPQCVLVHDVRVTVPNPNDGVNELETEVWARDEQHAVKIANERRAQLIARDWQTPPGADVEDYGTWKRWREQL